MYRRLYLATAAALTAGAAGCSAFAEDENGAPDNGSDNGPAEGRGPTYLRDDFEDLEAWDVIDGELSADTQRTVDGEQSALLESGIDSRAKITRSFPDPIDMDGQVPGLVVAAESRVAPMIHLVDANGNWIEYRQSIAGGTDFTPLNFGITRDSGEVDHSAITKIHITMWTGPTTNRLWIDDLHQTPGIEDGYVMIQFAGGYERVHEIGLPRLAQKSIPAVTFVPPGRLRETPAAKGDRLTQNQVADLADAGWTIGSQTYQDQPLAGEDRDLQKQAITDAIGWLEDNGYDARFVSIPRDRYDDTTLELLAAHHELGFGSRIPCHGEIETPMLVPRVNDPTGERVRHYLDLAERYGGVVSLDYYQLDDPASVSSLQMAVTEISSRRDSGSITVLTPDELMAFRA